MTYIQITSKCNMTCAHCCYSCGPHKGEHMSVSTFEKALELCGGYVSIGGGEPTMHPRFYDLLMKAIAECEEQGVWICTNGKIKDRALVLAKLAKNNVITAELSQDEYHDPISEEVVKAFSSKYMIRNTTNYHEPLPQGRGVELLGLDYEDLDREYSDCPCSTLFIAPNGDIRPCGCDDAPTIGTVDNPPDLGDKQWDCYKETGYVDWAEENGYLV